MHIEQFIRERQYLKGVSAKTLDWYRHSFRAFERAIQGKESIVSRIAELRQRGVSAVSVNTYLRCVSRDFKLLCKRLRIGDVRVSFHTLRHTFAVEYLRAGGNVLYLQRILGHTTPGVCRR